MYVGTSRLSKDHNAEFVLKRHCPSPCVLAWSTYNTYAVLTSIQSEAFWPSRKWLTFSNCLVSRFLPPNSASIHYWFSGQIKCQKQHRHHHHPIINNHRVFLPNQWRIPPEVLSCTVVSDHSMQLVSRLTHFGLISWSDIRMLPP